jgi:hypothetical protein
LIKANVYVSFKVNAQFQNRPDVLFFLKGIIARSSGRRMIANSIGRLETVAVGRTREDIDGGALTAMRSRYRLWVWV